MRANRLVVFMLVLAVASTFAQKKTDTGSTQNEERFSIGLPNIEIIPIKDSISGNAYELYVKLPKDYSTDLKLAYPVIYYTDAIWHLEMLSASTEYMLENVILVGISWQKDIDENLKDDVGSHVSRFRDYSIQKSKKPEVQAKYQLGNAKKHLEFIHNDVIPYVEQHYRTLPQGRTYFGYSLGGEFGAYVLLTKPYTFKNYILGSPSIKNEVPYLAKLNSKLDTTTLHKNNSMHANVFVTYGSLESEMVEPIEGFMDLLNGRRDKGLSLQREIIEGNHQSAFPMTAVRSMAWLSSIVNPMATTSSEVPFFQLPNRINAFINMTPEDKKDGIPIGELGVDGGNKEIIQKLAKEIADNKRPHYDSFLIYHKNKLIFESYYSRGRGNLTHPQASATKAYTCLALGRAIQLGYLSMADLDKPLIHFLKDLDLTTLVSGSERITLDKALTMRSGVRIGDEEWENMEKDTNGLKGQGEIQKMLELSAPITEESQRFKYQSDPQFVMQVLDAIVPGSAKDFIKSELLDKLEITNYEWRTAPSGLPEAGWRTGFTSRDMGKWGTLVRNKGKWKGEQLIPETYIERATSRILLTGDDDIFGGGPAVSQQGYGYYWWSADLTYEDKTYFCLSAQGGGGQYIILIEELDLMVVVTAHDNQNTTLQMIAESVLPAFIK